MPRAIGVVSGKGGVGKTVVAINTAASLHKYFNKKVLVVDANVTTPHVGLYLGLYSTPVTLNDAIKGTVDPEKAIYEHSSGIHAMPCSPKLEDMKDLNWHAAKNKITSVFDNYDIVVVDSAPGFTRESLITLTTCTEAIFVTNPIVHSAADLIKCRDVSRELQIRPLGIALNMVRNKKYELTERDVEGLIELNVLCSIPYEEKVMDSIISKRPAIDLSSNVDREILKIARHIAGGDAAERKSGFFSRLASFLRL